MERTQRTVILFNDNTPLGAIPFGVLKESLMGLFSEYLEEYDQKKSKTLNRGRKIEGIKSICEILGIGKDKFLSEIRKGNLDGVVFQAMKNSTYYGYEKDLIRKSVELYSTWKAKKRVIQG